MVRVCANAQSTLVKSVVLGGCHDCVVCCTQVVPWVPLTGSCAVLCPIAADPVMASAATCRAMACWLLRLAFGTRGTAFCRLQCKSFMAGLSKRSLCLLCACICFQSLLHSSGEAVA